MNELENKIIYYKNYIYKINSIDNKYYYLNKLIKDNELGVENDYKKILDFPNIKLVHFENKIDDKKQIKIKINLLTDFKIIDDIKNYYLYNDELKDNYTTTWATVIDSWNLESEFTIKYYISLLTNGQFKKKYKSSRAEELYMFCLLMCSGEGPIKGGLSYIKIIKNLGYEKIFDSLKKEAIKNEMEKFTKITNKNESCPICLSSDVDLYKGLYKCCHHTCYDCYMEWSVHTCSICRASDNYIDADD